MDNGHDRNDYTNVAFYGLLGLIYTVPLSEGAASKLSIAIIVTIIGGLIILYTLLQRDISLNPRLYNRLKVSMAAYGLFLMIAVVQCIPGISFGQSAAFYAQAAHTLNQPVTPFISVSPEDSLIGLLKLVTYGAVFWFGLHAGSDGRRAKHLLKIMLCLGGIYGAASIYEYAMLAEELARLNVAFAPPDRIMSLIRNHFAEFIGIHLVISIALLWSSIEAFQNRIHHEGWMIETVNRFLWRLLPLLMLLPILGTALVLSASRGGIASSFVGIIVLCFLLSISGSRAGLMSVLFSAGVILLLGWLFTTGGSEVMQRYANMGLEASRRWAIDLATWDAIKVFPWLGSGVHTFEYILKAYWNETLLNLYPKNTVLAYAFNGYEQTMLTMGIIGFASLMVAILWVGCYCLAGVFGSSQRKMLPAATIAIGIIVALHALVDYSMQLPSMALLVIFIVGMAFARAMPAEASQ